MLYVISNASLAVTTINLPNMKRPTGMRKVAHNPGQIRSSGGITSILANRLGAMKYRYPQRKMTDTISPTKTQRKARPTDPKLKLYMSRKTIGNDSKKE